MKKWFVGILKSVLPQGVKSKLKVFVAYHPYVSNPLSVISAGRLKKELAEILENTKGRKGIVICPPTIDWHTTLHQRPHQIARAFAKEGYLVIFCTNNIRYDNVKGFEKVEDNLYLLNNTAVLRGISKEAIVIISWAINRFYADRFSGSYIIYEYMDELDVFDGRINDLKRDHDWLVANANLVVATADKLFEEIKYKSKDSVLIPNGVDVSHFGKNCQEIPRDMKPILEKYTTVIGYYGALAEWFDYDLVLHAARQKTDWAFVLIGPLDYDKSHEKLKSAMPKNVIFLGAKKYEDLPAYGRLFNVATIPFKINKITESTSPIKLFEYMALGKPIVTTDMPECRKYKSVIISKSHEDFISKLEEAISLSKDKEYLRQEQVEANENSWQERAREMEKHFPK